MQSAEPIPVPFSVIMSRYFAVGDPWHHPARLSLDVFVARMEDAAVAVPLSLDHWAALLQIIAPEWFASLPAAGPTTNGPGTESKIQTMVDRHSDGVDIFHDADAKELSPNEMLSPCSSRHDQKVPGVETHAPPAHKAFQLRGRRRGMAPPDDD